MTDFAAGAVRPSNLYQFHCPTVGRDTLFMGCHYMKIKHWRGESIPCADCATAMNGGKCPAVVMLKTEDAEAKYFDTTSRMHGIAADVLARIAHILLLPFHTRGLELTGEQSARLFENAPLPGAAPSETSPSQATTKRAAGAARKARAVSPAPAPVDDRIAALDTLDVSLSDQLNEALELTS